MFPKIEIQELDFNDFNVLQEKITMIRFFCLTFQSHIHNYPNQKKLVINSIFNMNVNTYRTTIIMDKQDTAILSLMKELITNFHADKFLDDNIADQHTYLTKDYLTEEILANKNKLKAVLRYIFMGNNVLPVFCIKDTEENLWKREEFYRLKEKIMKVIL